MSVSLNKCRLCLRLGRFGSIFEEDDFVRFSEMVTAISSIEIEEEDGLPWHVCSPCVESLSAAYVFRAQCLRADLYLRTRAHPECKYNGNAMNASYSGLLHQDLHVHSRVDCSVADYDENVVDNNINKDIFAFNKSVPKPAEPTSESEIEANSMKCVYCQELLCNVENTHKCGESSSADRQTSDSDETVVVADNIKSLARKTFPIDTNEIKCLLCDERHTSYDDYVSHLLECTANVRIQFYECSSCHVLTTTMKEYLQHVKTHFQTDAVQSIDCVDSTRREGEMMQKTAAPAPAKPARREVGWSHEFIYRETRNEQATRNKDARIPHMVKSFLGLNGAEDFPKHSSPAKESIRKFIQAGREKTANYHCFGRGGKKLKKKLPKYRSIHSRKNVERRLFISTENVKPENKDNSNASKYYDAINESFSSISETSTDFATADEPIYATVEKKKIFMLSDYLKERESLARMLAELGAEVARDTALEMRASHFVCSLPRDTCSGMMVCALATGKWLLHHSYVTDSYARGQLLPESAYEWVHHPRLTHLNTTSEEVAKAGEFWRLKLEGPSRRYPFQGARVVLIMEKKYYKYYKVVFKTLKAKVFLYNQKDADTCVTATHCFVDMKSAQTCDLMFFANHNIPVYPYQYILIYLLKCGYVDDEHKYLLQDYKTLRNPNATRLNKTC